MTTRTCHTRRGYQMKSGAKRAASLLHLGLAAALLAWGCSGEDSSVGPSGTTGGETPNGPTGGGSPDGDRGQAVTLARLSEEIFTPRCATSGCHSGTTRAGGLSLQAEDIAQIVGPSSTGKPDFRLIEPGDPVNSYLLMKIRGDEGIAGDRMPPAGALEAEQIARVEAWVEDGAQVE